ncbi:hypothetical protein GCM10025866_20770 [Naasia aerilata]|uniref:Uncharacterized protein n=1 Tax=Naasia aerilata TaxID=1162966 RepID=A0ABN6XMK7_9MICO|nr:hypothetical protein GCM10025866_20770 [Naasia aerilata]
MAEGGVDSGGEAQKGAHEVDRVTEVDEHTALGGRRVVEMVGEDAARGPIEGERERMAVPDPDQGHSAECAVVDQLLDCRRVGVVRPPHRHHEGDVGLLDFGDDLLGLEECGGHHLLREDVLPRSRRRGDDLAMAARLGGHDDRVDVVTCEEIAESRVVVGAQPLRVGSAATLVVVPHGHDLGVRVRLGGGGVVLPVQMPEAEDSEADHGETSWSRDRQA